MTDHLQVALRETVKQCLEHSRHPPYAEPAQMDERGMVISARVEPVDHFLRLLNGWGYVVVSQFDVSSGPVAQQTEMERKTDE